MANDETQPATERRGNSRLRAVFVEACDVLAPFIDRGADRQEGQRLDHQAYQALRDRFPDLTRSDIAILVIAARRVFATGGRPVP